MIDHHGDRRATSHRPSSLGHNDPMLNPELDPAALAAKFQARGIIQISDIFQLDVADSLHQCLRDEIPWRLSCYDNMIEGSDRDLKLTQQSLAAMSADQKAGFQREILRQASDQFQYVYQSFDLLEGHRTGEKPDLFVYRLMQFLAGDTFFDFARTLTGSDEISHVDGHATRYVAGHFLKNHSDESPLEQRRFAYVIGMTRDWNADMGGMTQFLDNDGRVIDCLVPTFNSLIVFSVPVHHLVSHVPPWVTGERLSVTGWLTVKQE
jgi:Rps23 Pro-64 3,4-dihydroxylase Tpa1-like proline 4-hydroxylase